MDAVIKERLNNLLDGVRQALRPGQIFYSTLQAEPDQHRILLRLRDPSKTDAAIGGAEAAGHRRGPDRRPRPRHRQPAGRNDHPHPVAGGTERPGARRGAAVDRDRPPAHRRNRRGRSADHPAGQRPHRRAAPRHRRSRADQAVARQDRAHDLPVGGRSRQPHRRRTAADRRRLPADAGQSEREDRRAQARGRGRRRPDRRARGDQSPDRRMGCGLYLQHGRSPAFRRYHPGQRQPPVCHRARRQGDQRARSSANRSPAAAARSAATSPPPPPPTCPCCCAPARCRRR